MRKILLLIMITTHIMSAHTVGIFHLEKIPFNNLTPLYKRYARSIYANKDRSLYYKIWDHNYIRSPRFLGALKAGFFDDLTPLMGVIYDKKHQCRGYVTTGGTVATECIETTKLKVDTLGHIAPTAQQTNKNYITFYKRLLNNSIKSRYAFVDMPLQNIIELDAHFYLIDLESVLPFCGLEKNIVNNPGYSFCIKEYAQDLESFLNTEKFTAG